MAWDDVGGQSLSDNRRSEQQKDGEFQSKLLMSSPAGIDFALATP